MRKIIRQFLCMVAVVIGMLAGGVQPVLAQEPLHSAYDIPSARLAWASALKNDKKEFTCQKPVKPVFMFEADSRYCDNDKTRSIVCPEKEKAYQKASENIDAFNKTVIDLANRYVQAKIPRPEVAQCVVAHLDAWAQAGAWSPTSAQKDMTGEYKRGISVAAMAAAMQMVQSEPSLNQEVVQRVVEWLRQLGYRIHEYTQVAEAKRSNTGFGNHRYWEGLGIVQAAIVAQDRTLYDLGMKALRVGVDQVQEGGILPIEMKRAKKAFDYHLFAIAPLVLLEEIAWANGEPLDGVSSEKLASVVRLVTAEMLEDDEEGDVFSVKSYYEDLKPNQLAFLEIFLKRHGNPAMNDQAFEQARMLKDVRKEEDGMIHSTMLGGEVTFLFGTPEILRAQ